MTPEGAVKKDVKAFLRERKVASMSAPVPDAVGYYHMYVPSGYGDPALDFTGCYKGRFFAIETKADGGTPSARQNLIMKMHQDALGLSIWGNNADELCKRLGEFFDHVDTIT
ncbi:MAG: hypothetical protein KGL35_24760 [Bradyrhizobium sp.]|nr:hypothetical protein [Bradyrhizobium sp.]